MLKYKNIQTNKILKELQLKSQVTRTLKKLLIKEKEKELVNFLYFNHRNYSVEQGLRIFAMKYGMDDSEINNLHSQALRNLRS